MSPFWPARPDGVAVALDLLDPLGELEDVVGRLAVGGDRRLDLAPAPCTSSVARPSSTLTSSVAAARPRVCQRSQVGHRLAFALDRASRCASSSTSGSTSGAGRRSTVIVAAISSSLISSAARSCSHVVSTWVASVATARRSRSSRSSRSARVISVLPISSAPRSAVDVATAARSSIRASRSARRASHSCVTSRTSACFRATAAARASTSSEPRAADEGEGGERVRAAIRREAPRLECAGGIDCFRVLLRDRGRARDVISVGGRSRAARHTRRLGDAGSENCELRPERLASAPRAARRVSPASPPSVSISCRNWRDVLHAVANFLEPAIESGDLKPRPDTPPTVSPTIPRGCRLASRALDRVEQPVHPLLEHRVGLEPFLEGFEIAAHRTYGSLGAGERLVAPLFPPRDRFFAALLDLLQLAVGGAIFPAVAVAVSRRKSTRSTSASTLPRRVLDPGSAAWGAGAARTSAAFAETASSRAWISANLASALTSCFASAWRALTSCCAPRPSGPRSSARPQPVSVRVAPSAIVSRRGSEAAVLRRSRAVWRLGDELTGASSSLRSATSAPRSARSRRR